MPSRKILHCVNWLTFDLGHVRHNDRTKRLVRSTPEEIDMHKTLKTIIATLLLGSASLALASQANAAPTSQPTPPSQHELNWMDRASKTFDGGN
jgi:hypothetical protein